MLARLHARLLAAAPADTAAAVGADRGVHPRMLLRYVTDHLILGTSPGATPPPGYHDSSHLSRDGTLLLGMTPRKFLAMDLPSLRAVLRARRLVLGAAASLLDADDRA